MLPTAKPPNTSGRGRGAKYTTERRHKVHTNKAEEKYNAANSSPVFVSHKVREVYYGPETEIMRTLSRDSEHSIHTNFDIQTRFPERCVIDLIGVAWCTNFKYLCAVQSRKHRSLVLMSVSSGTRWRLLIDMGLL